MIRIHKVLGYGLTDIAEGDARINWASPLLDFEYELAAGAPELSLLGLAGFIQACGTNAWAARDIRADVERYPRQRLRQAVVHETEGGDPSAMVLVAPRYLSQWRRKDDIIDYVEAHFGEEPDLSPAVTPILGGIHPFDGVYMDRLTGTDLDAGATMRFRHCARDSASSEEQDFRARAIRADRTPKGAPELFLDAADALARIAPRVHHDIRALAEYAQLFNDSTGWRMLRPVHYSFWT